MMQRTNAQKLSQWMATYLAHFKGHEGTEWRSWEAYGRGTAAWVYESWRRLKDVTDKERAREREREAGQGIDNRYGETRVGETAI